MEKTDNELIEDFWVSQGGKPHWKPDISFYESSWDWLMPVVEKTKNIPVSEFNYQLTRMTEFRGWIKQFESLSIFTPIDKVYAIQVNFIKWYNSQPPRV